MFQFDFVITGGLRLDHIHPHEIVVMLGYW